MKLQKPGNDSFINRQTQSEITVIASIVARSLEIEGYTGAKDLIMGYKISGHIRT